MIPEEPQSRITRPQKPGRRSTLAGSHLPVMLQEVLTALDPQPGETAVDATLGGGG